jgi:hypothetical protein
VGTLSAMLLFTTHYEPTRAHILLRLPNSKATAQIKKKLGSKQRSITFEAKLRNTIRTYKTGSFRL